MLADKLFTNRAGVDEHQIRETLNIGHGKSADPADQSDVQKQGLKIPIIDFGSQGQTIGITMQHPKYNAGHFQHMQRQL